MGSIYRGPGIRTYLPTTQKTLSTRATSTAESTTSTEVSIWSTSIPSIKSVTIGLLLRPMFSVYTYNNYLNEIEPTSDLPSSSLSSSPSSSSSSILHLLSIILPVFLASLSTVLTVVWFLRYRCRSLTLGKSKKVTTLPEYITYKLLLYLDRQLEITAYQISPEGNSNLQQTDKEVAVQIADNGGKRGSLTVKGCPVDTSQGIDNGPLSNGGLGNVAAISSL